MQVIKKFLGDKAAGALKMFFENDTYVKGRNFADSADIDLIKVNVSDEVEVATKLVLGAAPTSNMHAANKQYVDDNITANIVSYLNNLPVKQSVKVASTANIDLATGGLLTIDGQSLSVDDRVLVKNQSAPEENGIYLAKSGSWIRSDDADTESEFKPMTIIGVDLGTANADKIYSQTSSQPATLGVSAITYGLLGPAPAAPPVPVSGKETKTLAGGDITNQYVDMAEEAVANSLQLMISGLIMAEGVDYSLSLEGGVTRITFLGALATGGVSELVAGDVLYVSYQYYA